MDRNGKNMYKTRMTHLSASASQPYRPLPGPQDRIYFATPGRSASLWPYQILVAGETHFPRGQASITTRFHTHTLIYTQSGRGHIELGAQNFTAKPKSLFWLDTSAQYAHSCHPQEETWSYLWFSLTGHALDALYRQLQIAMNPEFSADWGTELFENIVNGLSKVDKRSEAQASSLIAQILSHLSEERRLRASETVIDERIQYIMDKMRIDLMREWVIEDLAKMAQLSQSQLFRQFRRKTATTPLDWLRHERISQAKRELIDTQSRIFMIAEKVGYNDPYHFSRDFRRITGISPREFRRSQRL